MGAGTSLTAAGLLGPARYIATDVSAPALRAGRAVLPDDAVSVQCDAVGWPFREGVADVVMILGVLHHLSDWRAALGPRVPHRPSAAASCSSTRP